MKNLFLLLIIGLISVGIASASLILDSPYENYPYYDFVTVNYSSTTSATNLSLTLNGVVIHNHTTLDANEPDIYYIAHESLLNGTNNLTLSAITSPPSNNETVHFIYRGLSPENIVETPVETKDYSIFFAFAFVTLLTVAIFTIKSRN